MTMDGEQPSPPRRRGRPRRDAFIGPMNRPATWAEPNLPRCSTRAHREPLQEQANGTILHIEIGEDGRPRLLNGDQLRAENLQQLANGDVPVIDLEGDNEQAAPQPHPEPQPQPEQPGGEKNQEQEPEHVAIQDGEGSDSEEEQEPAPEQGHTQKPPQTAHFSTSSSPPVNFNPFGPPTPPQQLKLPNLLPQTPPPPPPPPPAQPQPQGQGPPAPASFSSSGILPHTPPPLLINTHIPNPPSTDSAIADVNTPTPEQILAELQQPQVIFDLSDFQNQEDEDEEEEEEEVEEENVEPQPQPQPQPQPEQSPSPPPPAQDPVPAGWQPGVWSGGWGGNDQQRAPGAVPFASNSDNENGGNEQEEWQQREEAIEWLRGNEGGEGQQPNEREQDQQPPNDESESEAVCFRQEPSETLSSLSSSSSSDSDDDHDPEGLGRGYEDDEERRDDSPEQDGRRVNHPYQPVEGVWYFNDSQESLNGPGPDEEEEGQDQRQPQEPRSSGSLPDFDDEQWEEEERALSRRNNRTSPLRWWERGSAAPRHPLDDLAIMPQRLANHDSVEHNALRWTSRPSVDFGEFSRPPMLPGDWSSEEDWDDYPEDDDEEEESNKYSCTGSSSSSNGIGGSSDSDDELPPVAMPVNGTRAASSEGSSVGRSSSPIHPSQETPPFSPPPRCLPDYSAVGPSSSSTKRKIHKGKKKTVPYPLDLATHLSKTFELDMAERTTRSDAPPPSAGISKAAANKNINSTGQQQQKPAETPATPSTPPIRKLSLRRNSAGPFQRSKFPSTTVFRSDFTFVPRNGRLSAPSSVSGDDISTHAIPDYIGQGDQDISPKTKNPPKVPQTGHVVPGTREARPQVGGKGFPQVRKDKGVEVYDPGEAYVSSSEGEDSEEEEGEDEGEEETEAMTRQTTKRRRAVVYDCLPFSAKSHLLRQVKEREQAQEDEEDERVGTYYQYNPRYDNEMGYTGGLTGSAVPAWMSAASQAQTTSWISTVSTESSNATKSSTWSAKRSISSVSDYDDSDDDKVIGNTPPKKRRLSPEPATDSSKRPRTANNDDGDEGVPRSNKRARTDVATPVHRQGLSANFVGTTSQQTDAIEEQTQYDPAMTENVEEYNPRTVGLPRTQGSPGSARKNRRQGSTEYDPATKRQEEEYDPQHP